MYTLYLCLLLHKSARQTAACDMAINVYYYQSKGKTFWDRYHGHFSLMLGKMYMLIVFELSNNLPLMHFLSIDTLCLLISRCSDHAY